jgi:hypothetical protein
MSEVPGTISSILEKVADAKRRKEQAAAELKTVNEELDSLESLAIEQIQASGLDGCKAAGYSWSVSSTLRVSVPKENRDAVMAAATAEGLGDEIITVQTATLKSWLTERLAKAKSEGRYLEKASDGTPFAGLLSEYVELRLSSRKSG